MDFTPEILKQHAQVWVDKRVKQDRSITAAYLQGSLLYGSPLLGGAGDVDLVLVHSGEPEQDREIQPLTPEIHLDIEHHDQSLYRNSRELRVDPWLGPTLQDAEPLYDPRHFLDYTQSGVRSNFDLPENILARAEPLLEQSRQFWLDRQIQPAPASISELPQFLAAVEKSVNALALLSGPPLPTRRLGLNFRSRIEQVGAPELFQTFSYLMGVTNLTEETIRGWIPAWEEALQTAAEEHPPAPGWSHKILYYRRAVQALLDNGQTMGALWPLFKTWTEAVGRISHQTRLHRSWIQTSTALGFAGKDYQQRLDVLDKFLDQAQEIIKGYFEPDGSR